MSTRLLAVLFVILLILAGFLFYGGEEVPTPGVHTMPDGKTLVNPDGDHVMPDGNMMHY